KKGDVYLPQQSRLEAPYALAPFPSRSGRDRFVIFSTRPRSTRRRVVSTQYCSGSAASSGCGRSRPSLRCSLFQLKSSFDRQSMSHSLTETTRPTVSMTPAML
ncbi:hypothetical protein BGZ65_000962, partial [Modicella reniformis]